MKVFGLFTKNIISRFVRPANKQKIEALQSRIEKRNTFLKEAKQLSSQLYKKQNKPRSFEEVYGEVPTRKISKKIISDEVFYGEVPEVDGLKLAVSLRQLKINSKELAPSFRRLIHNGPYQYVQEGLNPEYVKFARQTTKLEKQLTKLLAKSSSRLVMPKIKPQDLDLYGVLSPQPSLTRAKLAYSS